MFSGSFFFKRDKEEKEKEKRVFEWLQRDYFCLGAKEESIVSISKAHEKLTPKNSGEASEKLCRSLKKTVGAA